MILATAEQTTVCITVFPNRWAYTKEEKTITLAGLRQSALTTRANSKDGLPLIKLASFGNLRSPANSLRTNENMVRIFGVEGDYDAERIPLEDAKAILEDVGLLALLYTSPRHTEDTPRWRVLCPFSVDYPPEKRDAYMGRLNGLFKGIFGPESWTQSQSYYVGTVNDNPSHQVEIIAGTPIDLHDALDATWIGKPADKGKGRERPVATGDHEPISSKRREGYCRSVLDNLRKQAVDGAKHTALRNAALALGGIQVEAGFTDETAIQWLMDALPSTVRDWKQAASTAAWGLSRGREKPLTLETWPGYSVHKRQAPPPPISLNDYGSDDATIPPVPPDQLQNSKQETQQQPYEDAWPEPLDFLGDAELTGAPVLKPEHLPEAIGPFVFDTAARMGVDPAAVALMCFVALSSVISDQWRIQPKQNDNTWTENPRIWGAVVGSPSMLKSPILRAATAPIDRLEVNAREIHKQDMVAYRVRLKKWKDSGSDPTTEPVMPKLDRWLVEGATVEAISEVLRDDEKATQNAPAQKVLVRQDEMSEWVASFDRYRSGGKGGADRGAYLRLFNGGRYSIDRVGRGAFAVPNWSACVGGGIQPGPIRQIAKDAADDGLLQRFHFAVPERQERGEDRKPDADGLARYEALFPALSAMRPDRNAGAVALHADAHQHRLEILDIAEAMSALPDTSDRLKASFGKWPGNWARLTLVFHLIDAVDAKLQGKRPFVDIVGKGVAQMSTTYMRDILLPHLLRAEAVMFATEQTSHARWIAGFILSRGEDRITARDIMRNYRYLRAPEQRKEMLEVMDSLETMGWTRAVQQSDGRPPVAWKINPKVHTVFPEQSKREKSEREATKDRIRKTLENRRLQQSAA